MKIATIKKKFTSDNIKQVAFMTVGLTNLVVQGLLFFLGISLGAFTFIPSVIIAVAMYIASKSKTIERIITRVELEELVNLTNELLSNKSTVSIREKLEIMSKHEQREMIKESETNLPYPSVEPLYNVERTIDNEGIEVYTIKLLAPEG
jgi:hypothetical protein